MAWQDKFLIHFGPGPFSGITLREWFRILRENRFSVDSPHWLRAAAITLGSLQNSAIAGLEKAIYGRKIESAEVHPPLFVLGIWRSGTTHLHNLLARDDRFAYPNLYQVSYPHTFLLTERINARLIEFFLPNTRPFDNVTMGIQEPQEDESALCCLTGRSFLLSMAFPRRSEHYDRFLTLRQVSQSELVTWKSALMWFLRRLSFKHRRPLVLKSPGHTCRIKLLLELFPDAKFVHIHRNPYTVFQSSRHAVLKVSPWMALQRPDHNDLDERTIRQYKEVYDVFFEERDLIPDGHFHEVCFEELEQDPLGQVRRIYEALDLPDFAHVESRLREYMDSIAGYKKNVFSELTTDLRERIASEWRQCFGEWGYPI